MREGPRGMSDEPDGAYTVREGEALTARRETDRGSLAAGGPAERSLGKQRGGGASVSI